MSVVSLYADTGYAHPALKRAYQESQEKHRAYAGSVTPHEAWELFSTGKATLIDVRTAEERKFIGLVPGSIHVPWATGLSMTRNPRFVSELGGKVKKDSFILLLCRSGKRSPEALKDIVRNLCGVLFPMRLGPTELRQESEDFYVGYTLDMVLQRLFQQIRLELSLVHKHVPEQDVRYYAGAIIKQFAHELPGIRRLLDTDVAAAYRGDPAAHSVDEVLLCYPGVLAMIHHRIAHPLYELGVPLLARMIAELAHAQTGIDIHPGANIGPSFFIDHGTGVVIGETTVIGSGVRLYQAVTLGAKRFQADADGVLEKGQARHPIIEDEVVIYAGATILGRITIGKGSVIGGNVWLTHSVPANSQINQANLQQNKTMALVKGAL